MRRWLSWTAYPAVMAISVAATVVALDRGLPGAVAVPVVNFAAAVTVFLLERLIPYNQAWRRSHGDVRTDICHLVISGTATEGARMLMLAGVSLAAVALARAAGAPLWPVAWPLAAQLPLALLLSELGGYWAHRLLHQTFLWRLHAVHHSAPRLYWLNAMRLHPADMLLGVTLSVLPLALLGAGERLMAVFTMFIAVHMLLQHANIDVRLGPLNWLISMSEVHRWHHSRKLEEANANYGTVLLLWDIVFGTRRFPSDRVPPTDVGLHDLPDFPTTYAAQLAAPFRRDLWRSRETA